MGWYKLSTSHLRMISSYEEALAHWDGCTPIRGNAQRRKLAAHRTPQYIEKRGDGNVALIFGSDMVVYRPDNTIWLAGSGSESDTTFVNTVVPQGVYVNYHTMPRNILTIEGGGITRFYRLGRSIVLRRQDDVWLPVEIVIPFRVPVLDKARARAALRDCGHDEFRDWGRALLQMGGWPRPTTNSDPRPLMDMVKDREQWMHMVTLARFHGYTFDPNAVYRTILKQLRRAVYETHGLVTIREEPYLVGDTSLGRWARARTTYHWALGKHHEYSR
jgi:hypothetical protein